VAHDGLVLLGPAVERGEVEDDVTGQIRVREPQPGAGAALAVGVHVHRLARGGVRGERDRRVEHGPREHLGEQAAIGELAVRGGRG